MTGESRSEYQLQSPPTDAISSVRFGPLSSQFLLVSSWDGNVRLYDVQSNNLRMMYSHERPVLDCCFQVILFELFLSHLYFCAKYLHFDSFSGCRPCF